MFLHCLRCLQHGALVWVSQLMVTTTMCTDWTGFCPVPACWSCHASLRVYERASSAESGEEWTSSLWFESGGMALLVCF
eukprot:1160490-Pelagomonas_calceolata.AAC.13